MCLVAASSCLRQYLVQEQARLRYRYARWQDARVRHRWMRRQKRYRQDITDGDCQTNSVFSPDIPSPELSPKSLSDDKVLSSENGFHRKEFCDPETKTKFDFTSADGSKSWWVQKHRMMKVWMLGDQRKDQSEIDDGEEMRVMFVPANPTLGGNRTYVQFHSSGDDCREKRDGNVSRGVSFDEGQCINDEELVDPITECSSMMMQADSLNPQDVCLGNMCSCEPRACGACSAKECSLKCRTMDYSNAPNPSPSCCPTSLLYTGPSANYKCASNANLSEPCSLACTASATTTTTACVSQYQQASYSRVYPRQHFYPEPIYVPEVENSINHERKRLNYSSTKILRQMMKSEHSENEISSNTSNVASLAVLNSSAPNPGNRCCDGVYDSRSCSCTHSKRQSAFSSASPLPHAYCFSPQVPHRSADAPFPISCDDELNARPSCSSYSLEDKYKLYDNLVNCKDMDGRGGAGSSSDPIYSELNVAVATQDCEKLDESENLFNNESVPGMGVLSPQHLTQRLSENAQAREAVGGSDAELAQYLADERVALFLQNDEFMHELRANRDFMAALQREYEERVDASGCWEEGRREAAGGGGERREAGASKGGWNKLGHVDDATLRARIATMGKASRKKFAQIARVFSRSGKRCSGSPGGGSGGVSAAGVRLGGGDGSVLQAAVAREGGGTATDHLLEAAHPLIDEEDEEEEKILDDIVIGSVDVADLKEELAPMSLPQLSSSPRRAR
ncbi:uncharacterized protein LOC108680418 isoform X1 [Hyalella azteca]|uniref:Uncharacterized protein LOC108680418 isoform X1 n=1 Tax=Hyalella azteca TaxID=294128 RepID=A0A8B7PFE6_HYAAZ|nr:uncharacterized protein LOC108680418 isoform X1 [Hyalella azteca]